MYKFLHHHYHLKYKHVYRHAKKLFAFDLGLITLAIFMFSATAYFFLWRPGITDLVDIHLSINQHRILSGDEIELTINLKNRSELNLTSPKLKLELPNGFIIDRAKTPTTSLGDDLKWHNLSTIKSKANKNLKIYGWIWTTPQQEFLVTARFSYIPQDSNRHEEVIGRTIINLPDSNLVQSITGNNKSFSNQTLVYKYSIYNQSKYNLSGITLKSNWESLVMSTPDKNFNLKAGEKKEINFSLKSPKPTGSYKLDITPILHIHNQDITQNTISQNIQVISPDISSKLKINTTYINPNQTIPIQISWNNNNSFDLKNLQINISANYPQLINWNKTTKNNGINLVNNQLTINNQAFKQLANIKANSKENITINLYTKSNFLIPPTENNYLKLTPQIKAEISGLEQTYTQTGTSDKKSITAQLLFNTQTRYYTDEGDQIGRGLLPPKVGQSNKYYVYIQITPYFQNIKNIFFRTTLPNGVKLTNRDSVTVGDKIKFNANTREITWQYKNMLTANNMAGLYFEVQVTPTIAQLGQSLQLTGPLSLSAVDTLTEQTINISHPSLTNILPASDIGRSKGYKVVE